MGLKELSSTHKLLERAVAALERIADALEKRPDSRVESIHVKCDRPAEFARALAARGRYADGGNVNRGVGRGY